MAAKRSAAKAPSTLKLAAAIEELEDAKLEDATPVEPVQDFSAFDTAVKRIQDFHGLADARIVTSLTILGSNFVLASAKVYSSAEDQKADLPKGTGSSGGMLAGTFRELEAYEQFAVSNALANAGYAYQHYETQEGARAAALNTKLPGLLPQSVTDNQNLADNLTPRQQRAEAARIARETVSTSGLTETILQHVPEVETEPYSRASADIEIDAASQAGNEAAYLPMECNACTIVLSAQQQRQSLIDFGILLCPAHQREARSQRDATG